MSEAQCRCSTFAILDYNTAARQSDASAAATNMPMSASEILLSQLRLWPLGLVRRASVFDGECMHLINICMCMYVYIYIYTNNDICLCGTFSPSLLLR